MGAFDKFKEKRVEKMDDDELRNLLREKRLDDYTLDLIAKRLKPDVSKLDGYVMESCKNKFSEKQNLLRLSCKAFMAEDKIHDEHNFMTYEFGRFAYNHMGYSEFGVCGYVNRELLEQQKDNLVHINVPPEIYDYNVLSLKDAFSNTEQSNIHLLIDARNIAMENALYCSGVVNMIDFTKINPRKTDLDYSPDPFGEGTGSYEILVYMPSQDLYNQLNTCPKISAQQKFDFMLEHFNQDGYNGNLSRIFAKEYFGLDIETYKDKETGDYYITKEQVDQIMESSHVASKNASTREQFVFCFKAKERPYECEGLFNREIFNGLLQKFGVENNPMSNIYNRTSTYLSMVPKDEITVTAMETVDERIKVDVYKGNENGKPVYDSRVFGEENKPHLYLITTSDQISFIYNAKTDKFYMAGITAPDLTCELKEEWSCFNFTKTLSGPEKDNVLNTITKASILDSIERNTNTIENRSEINVERDGEER